MDSGFRQGIQSNSGTNMQAVRIIITIFSLVLGLITVQPLHAWKLYGHGAIGILAMDHTDETARKQLADIVGSTNDERMYQLCNWPDEVEDQPEWLWAAPQHYVSIPRTEESYDRQRDCPEGLCLTEAAKKYASELADSRLSKERREQAFAWLCHLIGDLHQPLHCGFADDRGGNLVDVIFAGETIDLHHFWDRNLIEKRSESVSDLVTKVRQEASCKGDVSSVWSPHDIDQWTSESHQLAATISYPSAAEINDTFEEQSWKHIQQGLDLAAKRLATILNAILGEGEVEVKR
jgi:hypothetical protein